MSNSIGLADYVEALRQELLEAMARGEGSNLRFSIEQAKVELEVAATLEADAKIAFKVFGIGADAGGGGSRTTTQKLTLALTPVDRQGNRLLVSDTGGHDDL